MCDPCPANTITDVVLISFAAGSYHTCALLDDRSVKCWGGNDFGQLGYGDTNDRGYEGGEMGDALPAVSLGAGARRCRSRWAGVIRARCWTTGR